MSSRAALNTVILGKVYQRGQFLTWPARQKQRVFAEHGIRTVVNLWHKVDPDMSPDPGDLGRLYLNWLCSPSAVPEGAEDMARLVSIRASTGAVLIHCEAGRGRSVWFSALVVSYVAHISGEEALALVLLAVPGAKLTDALRNDLLSRSAPLENVS